VKNLITKIISPQRATDWIDPKNRPKLAALSLPTSVELAPRPGLEPGTCGLTVRRSGRHNTNANQVLMCFSMESTFGHLMAVTPLDGQVFGLNRPRFEVR
jgi:hypothetical protein